MEEIELLPQSQNYFNYSKGESHIIYLTDYLDNFADHIHNFEIIRNATVNDTITLYINSGGGRTDIMMSYITALKSTPAETIGCAEGDVASAATAILLSCKIVSISPHTLLLLHDWSGSTYGKAEDMEKQIASYRKRFKVLYDEVYKGFLSNEELILLQEGKELYFYDGKDIQERLLNLQNYKRNNLVQHQEEMNG